MNVARPPALVMAATVSLPPSGSRPTTATGAPAPARAVAMPRPSPEPPPVTTAQPGTSALTRPTPATWSRMIPLSLRPPDGGGVLAPAPTPTDPFGLPPLGVGAHALHLRHRHLCLSL